MVRNPVPYMCAAVVVVICISKALNSQRFIALPGVLSQYGYTSYPLRLEFVNKAVLAIDIQPETLQLFSSMGGKDEDRENTKILCQLEEADWLR